MDNKTNEYKFPHHLSTPLDSEKVSHFLLKYFIANLSSEHSVTVKDRLFTDGEGNSYVEGESIVSNNPDLATIVNTINILQHGHVQVGPWVYQTDTKAQRHTILIVDDDESIRFITRSALESEIEANFVEAKDGNEALDICDKSAPDLVILDMIMPEKDGFATGEALKQMGIPFIAMTSLSDTVSMQRIIDIGCISFIAKPASHSQVVGATLSILKQIEHKKQFYKHTSSNSEVCTASGALAAYLSISPDQAYNVIREIGRDSHSNSKETSNVVNNFLDFVGKANSKHQKQLKRQDKRSHKNK